MTDIVDRLESSFHIYISTGGGATVKAMRPLLGEAAQEIRELRRILSTLKPEGEQISVAYDRAAEVAKKLLEVDDGYSWEIAEDIFHAITNLKDTHPK